MHTSLDKRDKGPHVPMVEFTPFGISLTYRNRKWVKEVGVVELSLCSFRNLCKKGIKKGYITKDEL